MAFAAVVSLKHTTDRLLVSTLTPFASFSGEIIESAYDPLKEVLERLDSGGSSSSSERLTDLVGQIRDVLHTMEEMLKLYEAIPQRPSGFLSNDYLAYEIISAEFCNFAAQKSEEQMILCVAIGLSPKNLELLYGGNREAVRKLEDAISLVHILDSANNKVKSLQEVLERLASNSSDRLADLDEQLREAAHKLEDALEFHFSNHFLPESRGHGDEEVWQEINSFAETVKKMEEEYKQALDRPVPEEVVEDGDDAAAVSSGTDYGVKMVGLSDEFHDIKNEVLRTMRPDDFGVVSIVGMAGTGRTIVARSILEELCFGEEQYFDCCAWVTVGPDYQFTEILLSILAQIDDDGASNVSEGDEKIGEYLYTSLEGRRYMIVLDDVRDAQVWDDLRELFPAQDNGSVILLTTAIMEVALYADGFTIFELPIPPADLLLDLIRMAMIGLESCPPELEETVEAITRNCRGLRILLAKVALFLCRAETTPEYWNKLAADKENPIFMIADEISEINKIEEGLQSHNQFTDDSGRTSAVRMVPELLDFSNLTEEIKEELFPVRLFPKVEINSFFGMVGIGKTNFVKEIFKDQSILQHFDHRAWVTLGPKYRLEEILVDVLAQIYPGIDKMQMKGDEKLGEDLCTQLSDKRCLIVLDDVWNKEALHYLDKLLANMKGKVLVTTRLAEVARFDEFIKVHELRLLNIEESWCLLRQKVFAEKSCPHELEKAGRKIADNCDGLPLTILKVAEVLCKAEKTQELWNNVAEKRNMVFVDVYKDIEKVLLPSYKNLPQYVKACFLYIGVFPQNYEIPNSKIINMWIAEGFLEPNSSQTEEDFAAKCLSELVEKSVVMVCKKGSNSKIKTCRLHSVFWHLANSEAVEYKFFHAFNSYADNLIQGVKSQRRLIIRNMILLGIKDVHSSMESISTTRSLLCTGPPHQYPVPISLGLRLLRVLDALAIRLYEFPIEVIKLIHLRYLALTCNGKLPTSISKLRNLQHLIVIRHLSIKPLKDSSYLPEEIWDMKKLKCLQITGSCLPKPNGGASLPNLLALLDVCAQSCTEEVLKGIPNLKRLGIQIELMPDNYGKPLCCFDDISCLQNLKSLKCFFVNPELKFKVTPLDPSLFMFLSSLRKLSLSGLGYPWEYMKTISLIENLEVLKLRCNAFQGPKWETDDNGFTELKFLLIEDIDLVCWKINHTSFPNIKSISIKHCYKLKELPYNLSSPVEMVEVIDSNPLAVTWAKQIKEQWETSKIHVHSSWDVGNLKQ